MITINSAQSNTVILYLDPTEQYFLFEFVSGLACGNVYLIPENVSTCADYQKFVINHDFGFGGVWTLNVYEQTSPVNTNPANATLLMTDLVKIVVDETCFNTPPIITNPCPEINPIDFSCEDLLTPYTGLTTEQINCVLASLTCDYLKDNLTYEQIACFGPPLSDYSCAQLLEGLTESQLSCLLQSFDCEFLNDPYLGLTDEQLACLPDKPIDLYTCEELLDPYLGLTDDQKTCVLQSLSCDFLNNQYTGLTDEQRDCVGKPIQEYTCEQLIDPYTGLSDNQKTCVLQALPCELITNEYTGLTDNQKACIIPTLSCDILKTNLTQQQIDCILDNPYFGNYRWWIDPSNSITSNISGTNYIDYINLNGQSDKFEQLTLSQRPALITNLNGNPIIDTTNASLVGGKMALFKTTNEPLFPSAKGTFSCMFNFQSANGLNQTIILNATNNASDYQLQLCINSVGNLTLYQGFGPVILLDTSLINSWYVIHLVLESTNLKYYRNGTLINTLTVTQNFLNSYPISLFNYVNIASEQGFGLFGDMIATNDPKSDLEVKRNYLWYKSKYPSLP